jgi:hypothetical protein
MLNQTNRKRLIQFLAITFLSSLLLASVASAETLGKGKIKGVEYCHDPLKPEKAIKTKVKDIASFDLTQIAPTDTDLDVDIVILDDVGAPTTETFTLSGNILANKNPKAGVFQVFGVGNDPDIEMAMNGKYKRKNNLIILVSGTFQSQDLTDTDEPCLSAGGFKAKS